MSPRRTGGDGDAVNLRVRIAMMLGPLLAASCQRDLPLDFVKQVDEGSGQADNELTAAVADDHAAAPRRNPDDLPPPGNGVCEHPRVTLSAEVARGRQQGSFVDEASGCPERLEVQTPNRGLSLDEEITRQTRSGHEADVCCYRAWFHEVRPGRPLVDGAAIHLPHVRMGARCGEPIDLASAARWLRDARMEASSVASFVRARRELAQVEAPRVFLDGCAHAAAQEQTHAGLCLGWAEHFAGRRLALGEDFDTSPRPLSLVGVLGTTFTEGCVAETIAALEAARAARQTDDPQLRRTLHTIARDETSHAALAWATVTWGLARLGDDERRRWLAWAMYQRRPAHRGFAPDPTRRRAAGHLDPAEHRRVVEDAWDGCIVPLLRDLESGSACHTRGDADIAEALDRVGTDGRGLRG